MRDQEYRAMFDLEESLWWYCGMREITKSLLATSVRKEPRLLDAGCGTGYSVSWLRKELGGGSAFGFDYSGEAAGFWKQRGLDNAALGSITEIPYISDQFDLVTCFDVIYQLQTEGAQRAVSEMHRVMSPGGMLFIREPAFDWLRGAHDRAVSTAHRYTRSELTALLESVGFSVKRASYVNTLLFWAAIPHRAWSRIRGSQESDVKAVSPLLNKAFLAALKAEARLLRRFSFPFGLSVVALAQKI